MRKGFTIVELMVVMAIISILVTIVFTSVRGAMKSGREQQADAVCRMVQAGLDAYHAQEGEWPAPLNGMVESGQFGSANDADARAEGVNGEDSDGTKYVLKGEEVRKMVRALVDKAKEGDPLLDISGLFVSRSTGEKNTTGYGLDFMSAVRGTKNSPRRMSLDEMHFGYPDSDGHFRRFKMVYSIPTDSLSVGRQ